MLTRTLLGCVKTLKKRLPTVKKIFLGLSSVEAAAQILMKGPVGRSKPSDTVGKDIGRRLLDFRSGTLAESP